MDMLGLMLRGMGVDLDQVNLKELASKTAEAVQYIRDMAERSQRLEANQQAIMAHLGILPPDAVAALGPIEYRLEGDAAACLTIPDLTIPAPPGGTAQAAQGAAKS